MVKPGIRLFVLVLAALSLVGQVSAGEGVAQPAAQKTVNDNDQIQSNKPTPHHKAQPPATHLSPHYYRAVVQAKKPFDRSNFTQGLEFHDNRLLVSSGLYGQSRIRSYRWPALTLERERVLPKEWFAEGLTRVGKRLFVLTWRARRLVILDYPELTLLGATALPTEGWGLTHAHDRLYWSDGSDKIYSIDAHEGGKIDYISVTLEGRPLQRLNELEWIDDELWANVWQTDTIVRIDPTSGAVVGVIDLTGLLAQSERQTNTDVLNGIAYDAANNEVWVTGKRWPWLYKIGLERQ